MTTKDVTAEREKEEAVPAESPVRPGEKLADKSSASAGVEVGSVQDDDEGDILEEDLDDIEYVPYSKKKQQRGGGGAKPKQASKK